MDLVEYVRTHNKTHVIFDFDATLFLLVLPWSTLVDDLKDAFIDINATIWDQYEQEELDFTNMLNSYLRSHADSMRDFYIAHSSSFEVESLERYEPNTDILYALKELQDLDLYIWSSNSRPVIDLILEKEGLGSYFSGIITKEDVGQLKPIPDGFTKIHSTSIPRSSYLMVGDSTYDKGAAEAAGIDFYLTDFFNLAR